MREKKSTKGEKIISCFFRFLLSPPLQWFRFVADYCAIIFIRFLRCSTGKQRKNRAKEFRGTAKTKGGAKDKKKK